MKKSTQLRELMKQDRLIVAPGATTALLARLVENAGFPAVYATGAGLANMNFGLPDFNLINMVENLEIVRRMNDAVKIPIIADIDDGYGAPVNVMRTVKEYCRAGIAAVQMEDQQNPKRCGHFDGQVVIPLRDMVAKIKAAKDAMDDPDMVLIARTDAISATGSFDEALERGAAFAEAGADVIFIEAPKTIEQVARIPKEMPVPTLLNIVEQGKTPALPIPEIERLGFRFVIYANAPLKASVLGTQRLLTYLKENGTTDGCDGELMITSAERQELLDKDYYQSLIAKYQ